MNGEFKPREVYCPREKGVEELWESSISTGINFAKYDNIEVTVQGENKPPPIASFNTAGLTGTVLRNVTKAKYTVPTPVQKYALPFIMEGRDLMACAQTGSGKTAAFLLPILNKIVESGAECVAADQRQAPQAVIITPTRELAIQICDEARKFGENTGVKAVTIYGGTSTQHQRSQLMRGCNILVATPGRLHDFVDRGYITFSAVQFLVLDEADRMLDMGFMPDIQRCVHNPSMPPKGRRQTLMFSATFPEAIQRTAKEFLSNYLFLVVGLVGGACTDVAQEFFQATKFAKREKLEEILTDPTRNPKERTLIFVQTKRNADFLATYLSDVGLPTTSIHGDRLQSERETALADFKTGKRPILVATAVAARGLDIKDVMHVVNYDMPSEVEEYVHRIGRTGRVGNTGRATSFFDMNDDHGIARDLVGVLTKAGQPVPDWLGGGRFY